MPASPAPTITTRFPSLFGGPALRYPALARTKVKAAPQKLQESPIHQEGSCGNSQRRGFQRNQRAHADRTGARYFCDQDQIRNARVTQRPAVQARADGRGESHQNDEPEARAQNIGRPGCAPIFGERPHGQGVRERAERNLGSQHQRRSEPFGFFTTPGKNRSATPNRSRCFPSGLPD